MSSPIGLGLRVSALVITMSLAVPSLARADALSDMKAQMQIMQQQMQQLQRQLQDVTQKLQQQQQNTEKVQAQQEQQQQQLKAAVPEPGHAFLEHKPGTATFYTPGGEVTAYGNLDVSIDATTKGIKNKTAPGSEVPRPTGRVGWQPDVSTNLSYLGLRGFQSMGDFPANFVWQLETQVDIAATSGSAESNSNKSNVVKGGLTSRNSFIGLSSEQYGSLYIGKSDAPYKLSTNRMNPFSGMLGDYQVIMGNTGGDNRVEFGTRLDHSIWYESPKFWGFTMNALYSPGQNRSSSSDNIASGESDCSGGNIPGSGGTGGGLTGFPARCNDGSFSDAVSADLVYSEGPLYAVAAYERHMKVNRNSDLLGSPLAPLDTADDDAMKVGVQYTFPTKTVVSGIVERMHRYVPSSVAFQNERQRWGTWFALSQGLTDADTVAVGWAHAFKTPGDPGQHNTPAMAHADNHADMITAMFRHQFNKYLSAYVDWAMTLNGPWAHYDLGAGGRAVTTDCHDASDDPAGYSSGGESSNPRCWAGGSLMGVSAGMKFQF